MADEDIRLAARRLVIASRAAQNLPPRVADPVTINKIVTILRTATHADSRRTRHHHPQVA
jgi:hypothetical protein